jgi:hypothetical protein
VRRLAVLLLAALGCSGPLEGEVVREPVADWSLVSEAGDVELATPSGRRFRSVVARPFVHAGALHLHVTTIFGFSDAALDDLLEHGRLDLRTGGRVHALRATRLTTPAEIDPLLPTLVRGMSIEATGLRWDPEPARYPATQVRQWFFRLEPADG